MIVAIGGGEAFALDAIIGNGDGRDIGRDGFVPHAEGKEDMRGHVLSVRRGTGDLAVNAGGAQTERRVDGVVIGVDQIVDSPWVLRIFGEHLLGNGGGAHVRGVIAFALAGAEQGNSVKAGGFEVVGIFLH